MAVKNKPITATFSVVDVSTGLGKTGDTANLTIKLVRDGVVAAPTNAPVEVDAINAPGTYKIALTASEMNCDAIRVAGKSSTANVQVIPCDVPIQSIDVNVASFGGNASIATSAGENGFISANVEAIGGDTTAGENLKYAFATTDKLPPANTSPVLFAGSVRTGDVFKATAVFTKGGAVCIPASPVTCSASFAGIWQIGHGAIGPRISEYVLNYGVLRDVHTGAYYVTQNIDDPATIDRRGKVLFRFHTDDTTVDRQDVFVELCVNMDIYRPELVEGAVLETQAKVKTIGGMTVIVQSPNITAKSFEIVAGDTYGISPATALHRPATVHIDGMPFSITGMQTRVILSYAKAGVAGVIEMKIKSDIVITNVTDTSLDVLIPLTDEETRDMAPQENATWEFKVFEFVSGSNWNDATLANGVFIVRKPIYDGVNGPDNTIV